MNAREALFPKLFPTATPSDQISAALEKSLDILKGLAKANGAPLARRNDPPTSKAAAKALTQSGARDTAKRRVLQAVKDCAGRGVTSHELSSYSGIAHPTVHKRLPDLRRDGLVENGVTRTCTITGHSSLTWKVKA